MPFPPGVQTVTVTAGASGYRAPDGTPYAGTIRFTPSVSRVVSAEHGVISLGPANATLGASGTFTETLLATDAEGFSPSGWTYRIDEEFTNAPGDAWNVSLPAAAPTVTLPSLSRVDSDTGAVSSPAVLSVNGETGVVALSAADVGADPAGTASTAVAAHEADTTSVHGIADTAALVTTTDPRLTNPRTPTAHAATHAAAGSDAVTLAQSQITGLTAALSGKADLTGATFTGGVTVNGADLSILGTGKGYRLRRGGGGLDLEATGADLVASNWSGTNFNGTQHSYLRLSSDAQNIQVAGKVEFVDSLYGTAKHTIDGAAGTASFHALAIDRFGAAAGYPLGRTGAIESASIPSSYAGGDDDGTGTDSTGRLNLYSYQRANSGSFGETIRNFLMRKDAKAMTAWYGPAGLYDGSRNPVGTSWQPWAWVGAHYESNDHDGLHAHWEVEVPDSTGALQGRLNILFADPSTGVIGLDQTVTSFTGGIVSVDCSNGNFLRLRTGAGAAKVLEYGNDLYLTSTGRRWQLRQNGTAESGANAGSDFEIARYSDTGALQDTPLTITRSNGRVAIGGTAGSAAGLTVNRASAGAAITVNSAIAGGTGATAYAHTALDTTSRIVQGSVTGEATARIVLYATGMLELGDGTNTRDTNLYRSAAATLKTDNSFQVGANLRINTTSVGGGTGVIGIANASVAPTITPTGGGVLYSTAGQGYWLDSTGVTTAMAGPSATLASDHGLKSWAFDPVIPTNSSALPAGVLQLVRLQVRTPATITNLVYGIATAATSATSGQCFVGLYDSTGTLLSGSADQASAWGSTGLKTTALTTPQAVQPGWYWAAFLFNGTTGPAIYRQQGGLLTMANAGLTSSNARFGAYGTTQTALPGPITPSSISIGSGITYWCAAS